MSLKIFTPLELRWIAHVLVEFMPQCLKLVRKEPLLGLGSVIPGRQLSEELVNAGLKFQFFCDVSFELSWSVRCQFLPRYVK